MQQLAKFAPIQLSGQICCVVADQGSAAGKALASGHAMWALLVAEELRSSYSDSTGQQAASDTESHSSSEQDTGAAPRGVASTSKKHAVSTEASALADRHQAWQQCSEHVQAALHAWQQCRSEDESDADPGCEALIDADVLPKLMLELLYMVGLHGKPCLPDLHLHLHYNKVSADGHRELCSIQLHAAA